MEAIKKHNEEYKCKLRLYINENRMQICLRGIRPPLGFKPKTTNERNFKDIKKQIEKVDNYFNTQIDDPESCSEEGSTYGSTCMIFSGSLTNINFVFGNFNWNENHLNLLKLP